MSSITANNLLQYFKNKENIKIAVIGLGYVGLPLAIEFAKKYDVVGFDINVTRVAELKHKKDRTKEADLESLNNVFKPSHKNGKGLHLSADVNEIKEYCVYIITVPTPINQFKCPDLQQLLLATTMVAKLLKQNDIVIYESTVYPGCTEEDCIPLLEEASGLKCDTDFYVGYSPERINPGDKINTLTKIKKVTSGSTPAIANVIDELYGSVITAGTYKAPSIKVAEASKAIENAQRDVNISFVNELALIFDKMGIDTNDVLNAAASKWNFLPYKPGLVGGHCIGVDPYYLAHKAQSLGYQPQVILSGRSVNDNMGKFVANKVIKLLIQQEHKVTRFKVLILGIAFKENCPDIRNTKVIDIYSELQEFGIEVDIFDPIADASEVKQEYGIDILSDFDTDVYYNAIIVAVAHNEFLKIDFKKIREKRTIIFDTKACLDRSLVDARL
ncbi:MAG: UDP-N-acetyl-D-glucosamine/UDP-N-acetyl-D-galactosamine dehydrogenase [Mucilaginibacter sp.]|nr:UDP-N-acetyl-D-glucosamine/UDP-N-acetyl-D-galactosamine dehydrogenase [Mucilaginibacter sp.]